MKQFPNALVPVRNRVALGMACHRRERGYGTTTEQGRCMGLWRFIARGPKKISFLVLVWYPAIPR